MHFSHDSCKNANSSSGCNTISEDTRVPAVPLKKDVDLVKKDSGVGSGSDGPPALENGSDSDGPPPLEDDSDWNDSDSETPPRFFILKNNFRSSSWSESKQNMATASSRR